MFKTLFKKQKPVKLGRWGHHNFNEIVKKIDMANCDSCGSCGKRNDTEINDSKKNNNTAKFINYKNFIMINDDIINMQI